MRGCWNEGSTTDPPALAFAGLLAKSDGPYVAYATVYPLTMLNVSIRAMRDALGQLKSGQRASAAMDFEALKSAVGFPAYYAEEARYRT